MSRTLTERKAGEMGLHRAGTKRTIRTSDLTARTVDKNDEVTIYSDQIPADALFAHGAGTDSRSTGRDSFVKCLLADSTGQQIEGDLEAVITDSRQRDVLARYNVGDLGDLGDAAADDRTERPQQPVVGPPAREDRYLQLRVKADEASDGLEIDLDESDVRLYYTDIDL